MNKNEGENVIDLTEAHSLDELEKHLQSINQKFKLYHALLINSRISGEQSKKLFLQFCNLYTIFICDFFDDTTMYETHKNLINRIIIRASPLCHKLYHEDEKNEDEDIYYVLHQHNLLCMLLNLENHRVVKSKIRKTLYRLKVLECSSEFNFPIKELSQQFIDTSVHFISICERIHLCKIRQDLNIEKYTAKYFIGLINEAINLSKMLYNRVQINTNEKFTSRPYETTLQANTHIKLAEMLNIHELLIGILHNITIHDTILKAEIVKLKIESLLQFTDVDIKTRTQILLLCKDAILSLLDVNEDKITPYISTFLSLINDHELLSDKVLALDRVDTLKAIISKINNFLLSYPDSDDALSAYSLLLDIRSTQIKRLATQPTCINFLEAQKNIYKEIISKNKKEKKLKAKLAKKKKRKKRKKKDLLKKQDDTIKDSKTVSSTAILGNKATIDKTTVLDTEEKVSFCDAELTLSTELEIDDEYDSNSNSNLDTLLNKRSYSVLSLSSLTFVNQHPLLSNHEWNIQQYEHNKNLYRYSNVNFSTSNFVKKLIALFREHHYIAFLYGGKLRDFLAPKSSRSIDSNSDFDIAVIATVLEIYNILRDFNPILKGVRNHKILTINHDGKKIDFTAVIDSSPRLYHLTKNIVSTRIEDYILCFISQLDFTLNTCCYDPTTRMLYATREGLTDVVFGVIKPIQPISIAFKSHPILILRALYLKVKNPSLRYYRMIPMIIQENRYFKAEHSTIISTFIQSKLTTPIIFSRFYMELIQHGIFYHLFYTTEKLHNEYSISATIARHLCDCKNVIPSIIYAIILLPTLISRLAQYNSDTNQCTFTNFFNHQLDEVIFIQNSMVKIPSECIVELKIILSTYLKSHSKMNQELYTLHSEYSAEMILSCKPLCEMFEKALQSKSPAILSTSSCQPGFSIS